MYDQNNIFAQILRKEIPCEPVYEDENVFIFNDINPQAKIHILAIPKIEVVSFNDFITKVDSKIISHFFKKINDIVIEFGLDRSGFKLISNNGNDGGQEVPHFHVHILGGKHKGFSV